MANKVIWGQFNSTAASGKTFDKSDFPKLEFIQLGKKAIGRTYKFRLLGSPVSYYKYVFQVGTKWKSVITIEQENSVLNNYNLKPKETFAINVLDRSDGKIKILEGPRSIFSKFDDYYKATEQPPGGPLGADFSIQVTGKKGKDFYVTEIVKGKVAFTEVEKAMLNKVGLFNLQKIFKITPEDKLAEIVAALEATPSQQEDAKNDKPKQNVAKSDDREEVDVDLLEADIESELQSVPNLEVGGDDLNF